MFTDGHCSAATCTPSRFSMLTGVHGFRNDVSILPPNAPLYIPQDKTTLPKLFKKVGYTRFNHHIDLMMGGSPCQGFSFAGHQLNFDDPRSKLFFDFIRIRDALLPKYVLLENVRMSK